MANHLQNEHSPYLQQHANNPVNWYPWGEEAFEKARKENKAIFVSIGYSSCHWCHVMEEESFTNETTAALLNKHFISIKVDREERPDIDKHFQDVYQLMNKRPGGWPLSLFITPENKPFYSATYIPDEPKYGMMSFSSLLEIIADKYQHAKPTLVEEAEKILHHLHPKEDKIEATKLDESIITRTIDQAEQLFDTQHGGFNKAPKFPQASLIELLIDLSTLTKEKRALSMALFSLEAMAKGGLRDLVEGGFCRYATDNEWHIPHFEKMTYDNALLSSVYLHAYHASNEHFFKEVAFETLDFMRSKMYEDGLFYTASDADTQGEEGKYFVYSYDKALRSFEKAGIPHKAHKELAAALHITKEGNFEGKNIVHIKNPKEVEIPYYDEAIEALAKRRAKRLYPFVDKKIIVSWNAMMVKALFQASRVEKRFLKEAKYTLERLLESMYIDGVLFHTTLLGETPTVKAFLEDYAYLGDALVEAYQTTLDESYLILAQKLTNSAIEKYYAHGKWKFSRGEFETDADIYDSSYPSSVAMMLSLLHSMSSLVDGVYKKFVFKTLEIYSYDVMRQPISTPKMTQMVIRYLKDDIIIKATQERLEKETPKRDSLPYPFVYFKADTNDGFMLCNSNSCFGHEKNIEGIEEILAKR